MTVPDPIFIFSSSWRSGSTLLQRFVTASGEVLVWGETGGALNGIADAVAAWEQITADSSQHFGVDRGGKGESAYRALADTPKNGHANLWIANISPPYSDILGTLRGSFETLYGLRARELGYTRYGFKETRCDLGTARQLLKLFPQARFIFLVRNPLDSILSIKRRRWMGRPPSHATLRFFAEHWRSRSMQFREADFGLTLRYEDFVADVGLQSRLLDYLEIGTSPPADFIRESHVDWQAKLDEGLSGWERARLRYWLGDEMRRWRYA